MTVDFSPRNIAIGIFRRKWAYAAFFCACVGLTAVYLALTPYKYESEATVIVNLNVQDLADMPAKDGGQNQVNLTADLAKDIVESQISILTSIDVRRAALEKIGIGKVYPVIADRTPSWGTPMDAAIKQLGKDLTVIAPANTMILEVALLNHDPAIAKATLQALLDAFFERQGQITRNPRIRFVEQQLASSRRQLDRAEKAYLVYRQEQSISSLDEERSLLLKERTDLEETLDTAEADVADAVQRTAVLRAALTHTPSRTLLSNENDRTMHQVDDATSNLNNAEDRYRQAVQTYAPTNPLMRDEQSNLAAARQQYANAAHASRSRRRVGANIAYQNLVPIVAQSSAEIPAGKAKVELRTKELNDINRRLQHLDRSEGTLLDLKRALDVAATNYQTYLQRVTVARVAEDLNRASITSLGLAQPATLPFEPARPRMLLLLALAIVVGLIGGFGLVLMLEILDETLMRPDQVRSVLGLPVLASIAKV